MISKKINIVVADDHPLFRKGLVSELEKANDFVVIGETDNAASAYTLVKLLEPDICLLDISMPGNGIEAARKISELNVITKLIMLTVSENDKDFVSAMNAGANGYILKGIGSDELQLVVRKIHAGENYITASIAENIMNNITE